MSKAKAQQEEKGKEYRYSQEIAQMMFVFGEVQDPNHESVNLVEDIVRSQVIEIVIQARQLAAKRGARHIAAEDLIFLIRYDRAKVNRLRTYMSWKDVRKNAKESGGDGKGEVEEALEEGADQHDANPRKRIIKLPWEITTIYTDALRQAAASNPKSGYKSDDEDEDEMEAHADSVKRLRDADEATRHMTKEEYMHYSECRQASFTYRKSKRFKDYLNLPPHLELRSDDTTDILGFLAFEIVRALTLGGLEVKRCLEESSSAQTSANTRTADGSPSRKRIRGEGDEDVSRGWNPVPSSSLFLAPPEARTPLLPQHIQDAFARVQRDWSRQKGAGMKNWRGGLVRTRISLI
ncbi:hypothetical protein BOTBODRAFT_99264 [Botryobasidium botryosum FD-172 SS1]|uniref:TFIID-18kDa-domain-containing protein n=1 Tax=Botryobasidium botryosum (strain FD-172 SS1) TaxID=930990 RepID=A0A067NC63_BOTB1|nr:hypothetical protein BOTBODRAFT_99264 [Botryobasidium botryosum FD-172 SS1]